MYRTNGGHFILPIKDNHVNTEKEYFDVNTFKPGLSKGES